VPPPYFNPRLRVGGPSFDAAGILRPRMTFRDRRVGMLLFAAEILQAPLLFNFQLSTVNLCGCVFLSSLF
jgi:hypothetical protein